MNRGRDGNWRNGGNNMPPIQEPYVIEYLENLDRELDHLKRKRELLEQQHEYLHDTRGFQPPRKQKRMFESANYYEQLYDAPQASQSASSMARSYNILSRNDDFIPLNSARKRPSPWQDDSVTKRFSDIGSFNVERSFGTRLGPKPKQGKVLNKLNIKKGPTQTSSPVSKKNKGNPKPLLSASPQRTPLTTESKPKNGMDTPVAQKPSFTPKNILTSVMSISDPEPSVKIRGRMELALGEIMKPLKNKIAPSQHRFTKQIIRERIKTLGLPNYLIPQSEIVEAYRAKYPPETDEDLVNNANQNVKQTTKYIETDDPQTFFKLNLTNIVSNKLKEMFGKIENLYKTKDSEVIVIEEDSDKNDLKGIPEKYKNMTFTVEELDHLLEKKLPTILKNYVPFLVQLMNSDLKYETDIILLKLKSEENSTRVMKYEKYKGEESGSPAKHPESTVTAKGATAGSNKSKKQLYFVSITGRPTLPVRLLMQAFLEEFEPKTIKKHKKRHNLLFVGFSEKENVDKIITKSGIILGDCEIQIKASDLFGIKLADEPTMNAAADATADVSPNTTEDNDKDETDLNNVSFQSESKILTSELDEQIDDLLMSIRQEDEEDVRQQATEDSSKTTEDSNAELMGDKGITNIETNNDKNEDQMDNSERKQTESNDNKGVEKFTKTIETTEKKDEGDSKKEKGDDEKGQEVNENTNDIINDPDEIAEDAIKASGDNSETNLKK